MSINFSLTVPLFYFYSLSLITLNAFTCSFVVSLCLLTLLQVDSLEKAVLGESAAPVYMCVLLHSLTGVIIMHFI